jgi:hypothetical protein
VSPSAFVPNPLLLPVWKSNVLEVQVAERSVGEDKPGMRGPRTRAVRSFRKVLRRDPELTLQSSQVGST